ncbi:MAG: DNRLRE domain-containing protein [Planctomycetota bacterium]
MNGFGRKEISRSSSIAGRDFRGQGRLEYVGERYLRFAGTGEYFLKQGADSPENLLAYDEFDGPFANDGQGDQFIKDWAPHVADWQPGDPTWGDERGKGLIGAVNYLASEGQNAFSFLPMNIAGDDKNVFPYLVYNERLRMDVSRLAQWEVVFEHADQKGMFLHFKTQETENDQLLDGGNLGTQRKLYYRELIARFGHHLALNWNLGEEITNTTAQIRDFAQYFRDIDPYDHHIVAHTFPGQKDQRYDPLLGNASELTGASLQTNQADFRNVHTETAKWVRDSAAAGKPWAIAVDEPGDAQHALRPDNDRGNSHEDGRKNALWGTLMAGGWGNEYYFGYGHNNSDLTLQDFRSRDEWWDVTRYALEFFNDNNIPFWEMENDNVISTAANDYGFYKAGDTYTVYLKDGGTTDLDLSEATGTFDVRWFDPRNGGGLQVGSVSTVTGGGTANLGTAPNSIGQDWAILIQRRAGTGPNEAPRVSIPGASAVDGGNDGLVFDLSGQVIDDGQDLPSPQLQWSLDAGPGTADFGDPTSRDTRVTFSQPGTYRVKLTADDGEFTASSMRVIVAPAVELPSSEVTLAPIDDATVENANGINDGFIKVETSAGRTRTGYLKFDVSGFAPGEIATAKLRLTVSQDAGNGTLNLRSGATNDWTEEAIDAANAPAAGSIIDTVDGTHGLGAVREFDVESVVVGDGTYTFVLEHGGGNDVWFSSKEGGAAPQLVLTRPDQSIAGDYDRDGDVDLADKDFWEFSYGPTIGDGLQADGNGDGVVNVLDYLAWRDDYEAAQSAASQIALASEEAPVVGENGLRADNPFPLAVRTSSAHEAEQRSPRLSLPAAVEGNEKSLLLIETDRIEPPAEQAPRDRVLRTADNDSSRDEAFATLLRPRLASDLTR